MQKASFQSINNDVSVSSSLTKCRSLKTGSGGNRAAWRIQIRSGPEGARGVLKKRARSFWTFRSELLFELLFRSLNSSESHLFLKFPSWKSPFSEFSSTFVPPEVTFLEISGHSLHFSEIYLANYVGHMQVVFLMRLSAGCLYVSCWLYVVLGGRRVSRDHRAGIPKIRPFFRIDFLMFFSWFWHRFWMTFLMIFQCFLHHFFETFFSCFFEVFRIDFWTVRTMKSSKIHWFL